jgi:hypothetical protein
MEVISKQIKMRIDKNYFNLYLPKTMAEHVGFKPGTVLRLKLRNNEMYLVKSDNNIGMRVGRDYNIQFPVRFNDKFSAKEHEYIHMWIEGKNIRLKFARGQVHQMGVV